MSYLLVAATLVRDVDDQKMSAYFRQTAGDIKSEKELAQGKFLVADRRLIDSNFRETVVLLIRYGPEGAMGLVINRPVQLKLSTVLPDIKELDRRKETLYLGGPVESTRILLLVRSANPPEASMPVFGDVYLSSSQNYLFYCCEKMHLRKKHLGATPVFGIFLNYPFSCQKHHFKPKYGTIFSLHP
jgi:hypothetical protein